MFMLVSVLLFSKIDRYSPSEVEIEKSLIEIVFLSLGKSLNVISLRSQKNNNIFPCLENSFKKFYSVLMFERTHGSMIIE